MKDNVGCWATKVKLISSAKDTMAKKYMIVDIDADWIHNETFDSLEEAKEAYEELIEEGTIQENDLEDNLILEVTKAFKGTIKGIAFKEAEL